MTNAMDKAVAFAKSKIGCGYIYGATGWVCTPSRRAQQAAQYPEQYDNIMGVGAKWDGKECYDCAQLTRKAVEAAGGFLPSGANSQWKGDYWLEKGDIGDLPYDTPCFVYRRNANGVAQHTGLYIGDGWVIEARGTREGIIRSRLEDYPWTDYAVHTVTATLSVGHEDMTLPYWCVVKTKTGGGISIWATSAKAVRVAAVPEGARVLVTGKVAADGFVAAEYGGGKGVADAQYLRPVVEQPESTGPAYIVEITGYRDGVLSGEQAMNIVDDMMSAGYVVAARVVGVG